MNFSRLRLSVGFAALLGIATAAAGLAQNGSNSQVPGATATPLVTPAPLDTPAPLATPTGGPRRGRRAPKPGSSSAADAEPSDTPEPPQFTTLDGVWEVEVQPLGQRLAVYTHLNITTTGSNITGYWLNGSKKKPVKSALTGTFDGRLISMTASMPDGSSTTFSGYVEAFGDMVGLVRTNDNDPGTAFTAQHRKKLKASG